MSNTKIVRNSHNVSILVYHVVRPTKYRRVVLDESVDEILRQVCEGVELRYDWLRFIEIGVDKDHVHFLVQSTPNYSPTKIVTTIKSITAKQIFAECPQDKKMLWGGQFWSDGYFVSSVGKYTNESVIREYVKIRVNKTSTSS